MNYDQELYTTYIANGIPARLALLMVGQARVETGNYTSNVFHTDNNCYGYKYVGQSYADGPGVMSPEGNYYAHYSSIQKSALEMVAYVHRRQNEGRLPANLNEIQDANQWATYLKSFAFFGGTAANYAAAINADLQRVVITGVGGSSSGLLIVGLVIVAFIVGTR